jgi:hypothetical protein
VTALHVWYGLLAAVVAWGVFPLPARAQAAREEPWSCAACHHEIVASFLRTAHFRTSATANAQSIKGDFSGGHNILHTRSPSTYFKMEERDRVFYQTGVDSARGTARTERIDLVVGSGRRGQSYLYWRFGLLFELPVSYLTGIGEWINSPGYRDGEIDFGRVIVPRCLECHSTFFGVERLGGVLRYSRAYRLGIRCARCHGDGGNHVRYHSSNPGATRGLYILNPTRLPRERKVDVCAQCHSGPRELRAPPFSYQPGDRLDAYFAPPSDRDQPLPDVHGDQVGLLLRSKCFRSSPDMSCSTCHDVHRSGRDLETLAQKCLTCHNAPRHTVADSIGSQLMGSCVDCHMPKQRSHAIEINTATTRSSLYYRSHAIAIYPEATAAVLRSGARKRH